MATIQFKRGTSLRWAELNPVLAEGEPGYDTTNKKLKIGDGETAWRDLPYENEKSIVSRKSYHNFPSYGDPNVLYKDESASQLYQWLVGDDGTGYYSIMGTEGVLDIEIIYGGNADVTN